MAKVYWRTCYISRIKLPRMWQIWVLYCTQVTTVGVHTICGCLFVDHEYVIELYLIKCTVSVLYHDKIVDGQTFLSYTN